MTDTHAMLTPLRQVADAAVVAAIETLVREAPDAALARVNPLAFAEEHGLAEQPVVAAFLHAARLGLFDLSWNVLCPSCGGVLDANTTLKSVHADEYYCAFCAVGHEPTLDEMVEVSFTVNPRLRRIAAHDPSTLPLFEYMRQVFLSSGVALPADPERRFREAVLDEIELPPGEKAILSLQLPEATVILFDPVTHGTQFVEIAGEPTNERQTLSYVFSGVRAPTAPVEKLRPGPLRLSLENRSQERVLPALWLASGEALHSFIGHRRPFLTAKRLLSNQTFRDLYGTDTLDIDQRLKITSLTFLFTDLRSSTAIYERVGDLAAYDLVRAHFQVLSRIVAGEAGAVVKTIGDAVMATFPTPGRAVAAALRMREAMRILSEERNREDLVLKIGIHEGPCLAVNLNERQDYFGQTVNIASRVQNLAVSRAILATASVIENDETARLLAATGNAPLAQRRSVPGLADALAVYEIP